MKKTAIATPFKNPRDGILYFRREVPEKLRAAFDGKQIVKVSLRTRDPIEAKALFARKNAKFEKQLADARRHIAEGILVSTPGALVRRWREGPAAGSALSDSERLILTFTELDAPVGGRHSASADGKIYPPAILGPAINTDWSAVLLDKARFEKILSDVYGGDLEQTGTNWIRARWQIAQGDWSPSLAGPIARLRMFDSSAERFNDDELTKALLAVIDEKRTGDEDFNRARLSRHRPRATQSRLRPHMRLKQLFREWKAGNEPRPRPP